VEPPDSRPLFSYTRNPNFETTGDTDDVPNLTQSQIRLGQANKQRTNLIWGLIIFLVILLLAILGFLYYRNERYIFNCEDCIKLNELKSIAENNPNDAIDYVKRKVDHATDAKIPEDREVLLAGENFHLRINRILEFREKIDELLKLNSVFAKELNKALSFKYDVQHLEDQYHVNMDNLKNSTDQIIDYLASTFGGSLNKEELQEQILKIRADLATQRGKLNEEKARVQSKIHTLESNILKALDDAHVRTDKALDDLINNKIHSLENRDQTKQECQTRLPLYNEELNLYYQMYSEELQYLEDIDIQLRQSKWVDHVLNTIKGFMEIKKDLEQLQSNGLADGLRNLNAVVENLRKREEEFTALVSSGYSIQSIKRVESHTTTNSGEIVEDYKKLEKVTKTIQADDFKELIEKEKNLLITWAWDQFSIFNISNNEIRNVTNAIKNFNESLKTEQAKDHRNYVELRIKTQAIITEINSNITRTEGNIKQCERFIHSTEDMIKLEEAEVERLQNIKKQIEGLRSQIISQQAERNEIEEKHQKELDQLEDQRNKIQALIDKSTSEKKDHEAELKELTRKINEILGSEPKPQVIEKKLREYKTQVQSTNKIYRTMSELLEEIKSISQN